VDRCWSRRRESLRQGRRYDNGVLRLYDLFWDGDDNLRRTDQAGSYGFVATYNGDGLRVTKSDFWTVPHTYTWGLGGVLYDSSNNTTYTPGVSQNVNGTDSYFHSDWLGSTRYLTDSTGNTATAAPRYTAFGERSNALGLQPPSDYQFAGEWGYQTEWAASYEPGTGLEYLQQRYYDPAVGRFLSPDTLSFAGGFNLFSYAANDPVMNLDPDGERWKQILGFLGGVGGGLLGAPEGGIGAIPGAAWGAGIGAGIGSRLDGESVGRSVVNGVVEGGFTLVGGKLVHLGVEAYQARRALQAARAVEALAARATQVHEVLDPIARNHRTAACLLTRAGRIVGGGVEDLSPAQRALLGSGEIAAKLRGAHAEITVLQRARELGVRPEVLAASRPFCPECVAAIRASGGRLLSPTTAIWPR
jgi:RHS repeat-associated protein